MLTLASSTIVAQPLRFLIFFGGMFLVGMAVFTFWSYIRKYRADLLPQHIVLISSSYSIFVSVTVGTQLQYALEGRGFTWQIPPLVVAEILGLIALDKVMRRIVSRNAGPKRRDYDPA